MRDKRPFVRKHTIRFVVIAACLAGLVVWTAITFRHLLPKQISAPLERRQGINEIRAFQTPRLTQALSDQGLTFGSPVFIRIFKEEAQLELWVEKDGSYTLFRHYPICNFSGHLGPKLKEGDRQSPEGIYKVGRSALNPNSSFHLSFNLGFPNAFDRAQGRTGSFLMVHGNCVSVGCYAMTDPLIEEIYVLVEAALLNGQTDVPVHAFPFRMTQTRMAQAAGTPWFAFWQQLAPIYQEFEHAQIVPEVHVSGGVYQLVEN